MKTRLLVPLLALGLTAAEAAPAPAQPDRLVVVSWNVESGNANPTVLAQRIRAFQGVDLWGLSEVDSNSSWMNAFEPAAEDGENADFRRILGTTGGSDRLAILFNSNRFELVGSTELSNINVGGTLRAPLVAHLRNRATGGELLFVVNHLARGNSAARHQQGTLLNTWARQQTLPVVAVGDYNFDWDVANGDNNHEPGFDRMTDGGVFAWVRPPAPLVRTQCSENSGSSGGSVLDFVFTAGAARSWTGSATIERETGDCPDPGTQRSDHRPVRAEFRMAAGQVPPATVPTRAELLQKIQQLEQQVRELRQMIERLPQE